MRVAELHEVEDVAGMSAKRVPERGEFRPHPGIRGVRDDDRGRYEMLGGLRGDAPVPRLVDIHAPIHLAPGPETPRPLFVGAT